MKIRIPKNFNKWEDKLICPKCKERSVVNYWHKHQQIIGSNISFQCKNCFMEFDAETNETRGKKNESK